MRVARPIARGRKRLSVGPSSAVMAWMRRSSPTSSWLCSALATADSSSLLQSRATERGVCARIARASCTALPRTWSATRRDLRAEDRTYLAVAPTTTRPSARRGAAARRGRGAGAGGGGGAGGRGGGAGARRGRGRRGRRGGSAGGRRRGGIRGLPGGLLVDLLVDLGH